MTRNITNGVASLTSSALTLAFASASPVATARPPDAVPSGSWSLSCHDGHMSGEWLVAECKKSNGEWLKSSIDMTKCPQNEVWNREGHLTCGAG